MYISLVFKIRNLFLVQKYDFWYKGHQYEVVILPTVLKQILNVILK